ncbi:insulin-induced protein-domain-containing protein [Microdochium trichocladiopsis]|uniref:Insulin-induced protein-domain-containing protein n=1 Tax=Microdochium trichocladiopsis TaxID=1682393 RepID=A0A9P9BWQ3_9PEZI|nr:insulin-induced protein-domain-containing protein [Microdochium trichocladiopsis]KAH7041022.1 insulin-induced protein-domain-containing protein [Microdochium trichocladiopsis]
MTDAPDNGPTLFRPVPRRPFNMNIMAATPPDDMAEAPRPPTPDTEENNQLNLDVLNSRLLAPSRRNRSDDSNTISRAESVMNLGGSTLMGIYTPNTYGKDRFYVDDKEEATTPWGTGAETPARHLSIAEPHFELQNDRYHGIRRRSSSHVVPPLTTSSYSTIAMYTGLRTLVLGGLGVLYGVGVAEVQDRHKIAPVHVDGLLSMLYNDWRYMAFWGLSGVLFGSLLPWFDNVWEKAQNPSSQTVVECSVEDDEDPERQKGPSTDWALAVRGIGTFVGIAFAIRKLPWNSTLQLSLTLAMVNPVLWFLIDRSTPGFLVSSAVGLAGSVVLLGLKPEMVATPAGSSYNTMMSYDQQQNASNVHLDTLLLGGWADQRTLETGIWMLSVLFCCALCFGNIGRRMVLNRSAPGKGRWASMVG